MPQRCRTLLDIGIDVQHPRSAAKAVQKRRRRPRVLLTAYAPRCSGSTLDTLERCQRPRSANPADLWLVLDATSAGSEGTVVLNVIVTHTRSRNTCNVKAVVGGPPRRGLDHAVFALGASVETSGDKPQAAERPALPQGQGVRR